MTVHHERTLGRLEGKLDHLIEAHADLGSKWEKLSQEFAALLRRQDALTHELIRLKQRLDEMSEPAREFGRWRERAVGALMLLSFGGALLGGSAVAFWQKFSALLR